MTFHPRRKKAEDLSVGDKVVFSTPEGIELRTVSYKHTALDTTSIMITFKRPNGEEKVMRMKRNKVVSLPYS